MSVGDSEGVSGMGREWDGEGVGEVCVQVSEVVYGVPYWGQVSWDCALNLYVCVGVGGWGCVCVCVHITGLVKSVQANYFMLFVLTSRLFVSTAAIFILRYTPLLHSHSHQSHSSHSHSHTSHLLTHPHTSSHLPCRATYLCQSSLGRTTT